MRPTADSHEPLTARISVLVAGVLGVMVAGFVALLTTATPLLADAPSPATLGLAVLALAVAGMVRVTAAGTLTRRPATTYAGRRQPTPALASRVADPVHHPVRPRAPGTV